MTSGNWWASMTSIIKFTIDFSLGRNLSNCGATFLCGNPNFSWKIFSNLPSSGVCWWLVINFRYSLGCKTSRGFPEPLAIRLHWGAWGRFSIPRFIGVSTQFWGLRIHFVKEDPSWSWVCVEPLFFRQAQAYPLFSEISIWQTHIRMGTTL